MKTLYIILLLIFTTQLCANELTWVDEQISAIKPPRVGISDKNIAKLKNPFIFSFKQDKHIGRKRKTSFKKVIRHSHYIKKYYSKKFYLEAILNKSVMINGRWYKEGQWIYGYKIVKVNRTSVLLQKQNKKLLLSTMSKSINVKFHNKIGISDEIYK